MTMWSKTKTRVTFAVVLWLLALIAPLLLVLDSMERGSAVEWVDAGSSVAGWVIGGAALVILVGLLLYPPFLPATRVRIRRLKSRIHVDQAPLRQAIGRLEHHETADDHFIVAQVSYRMGEVQTAVDHCARALEIEADCTKARNLLAKILAKAGQHEQAAALYDLVVRADPSFGFGDALLGLASSLDKLGQHEAAEAALATHEELHGGNRQALLLRARVAAHAGDKDKQREFLTRAAAPQMDGEIMAPEAQLARARARVALMRIGGSK